MKIPYAAAVGVTAAVLAFGVPNALAQSPKTGGTLTFAVSAEPPTTTAMRRAHSPSSIRCGRITRPCSSSTAPTTRK